MALLFMDGFDHYATADITKKWDYQYIHPVWGGYNSIATTAGRRGGGALEAYNSYGEVRKYISGTTEVIVGVAVKPQYTQSDVGVLWLAELDIPHIMVKLFSPVLKVYSGSTLLGTGVLPVYHDAWTYIEVRAVIDSTAGVVQVKVNGVQDSGLNLSGVNTSDPSGTGVVTSVTLGDSADYAMDGWYDDLYICDATGSINNTFLGDSRVDVVFPDSDGYYTAFDPSVGTDHYVLVDDIAPNALDYVSTATDGVRDSFGFPELERLSSQIIRGAQVNAAAQKSDSGAGQLAMFSRLGSTNADGVTQSLATTQSIKMQIFETDPSSTAWTQTTVNSAEFGVKAVIA